MEEIQVQGTNQNYSWDDFIKAEASSKDTIDVKKIYCDMAGDLIAGVMLSQIVYWHLPSGKSDTKLVVKKQGQLWLAKQHSDWWSEVRITERQSKRAMNILRSKALIITGRFMFNAFRTLHIRLNKEKFLNEYSKLVIQSSVGTKGIDRKVPNVSTAKYQTYRPLTENTSEITNKDYLITHDLPKVDREIVDKLISKEVPIVSNQPHGIIQHATTTHMPPQGKAPQKFAPQIYQELLDYHDQLMQEAEPNYFGQDEGGNTDTWGNTPEKLRAMNAQALKRLLNKGHHPEEIKGVMDSLHKERSFGWSFKVVEDYFEGNLEW